MIDYDGWDAYRAVLVTGPQRSGTTFAAHAIAADTGREYFDEESFKIDNEPLWWKLVTDVDNAVVHCPGMMHRVTGVPQDVLVVVMWRPITEIIASQNRVGWGQGRDELGKFGRVDGEACVVKYAWLLDNWQRIPNLRLVAYHSLSDHPMWVEDRSGFAMRQWRSEVMA